MVGVTRISNWILHDMMNPADALMPKLTADLNPMEASSLFYIIWATIHGHDKTSKQYPIYYYTWTHQLLTSLPRKPSVMGSTLALIVKPPLLILPLLLLWVRNVTMSVQRTPSTKDQSHYITKPRSFDSLSSHATL